METKQINVAINAAMAKIKQLRKDDRNPHGNYSFASIDAFLDMCRPICSEHGLHPQVNSVNSETFNAGNGKLWAKFSYLIAMGHVSGETTEPVGMDVMLPLTGAQTSGSAQSYAVKQFLRGLLLISTGDKDDVDLKPQAPEEGVEAAQTPLDLSETEEQPDAATPATPPPANADVDWSKWVNDQMNQIKDANKIKLLMWSRKTQKQREDLKEADRELSATLGDFYQQKYEEQNTGER